MSQRVIVVKVALAHLFDPVGAKLNVSNKATRRRRRDPFYKCRLSSIRFSRFNKSALHSSRDCLPFLGGSRTPSARLSGFGGVVPFSSSALSAASRAVMCGCGAAVGFGSGGGPAGGGAVRGVEIENGRAAVEASQGTAQKLCRALDPLASRFAVDLSISAVRPEAV